MVERELAEEGLSRVDLGREAFLERMWRWKERFHGNIRRQLDLLGASCDWTRERFTLDEGLSRAVREAFVRLHAEGKITRGEYLVNWSTGLDTAISDLEVEMKPVKDKLWRIAYPLEGGGVSLVVATTRPETMLGDTALAVHPEDGRYRSLVGKMARIPVAGRLVPIVADDSVEREFGTGVVKVTPFHDLADFELGRRHALPGISVIDRHGRMTPAAGAEFSGLDVDEARERLLERLRAEGALVGEEDYLHNVGFCQRSGVRVQPLVSTQWFCDVKSMADEALAANRDGRLELVPASWAKTWEHWLENIRPWCISRQLWWGHQIPAWYDEQGNCFVARSFEEAAAAAGTERLRQDQDVLDTWFSSALWPFSTLGWPDETADLATFYPTSVLITGFDILFFWVARMAMTGLHFTGRSPFARVHLTGLVRDAEGVKMSKTKGNVLDPEDLVEEYGADAVRFTLALLDSPGRDIPLDPERMAGYRAFGNKIWNATRFVLGRVGEARVRAELDPAGLAVPERWIVSRLAATAREVDAKLEAFRFDEACHALYHFFWSDFCDWSIEVAKPALSPEGGEAPRPRAGEVLLTVLERALRLLHPVMPFLTEELWQRLPGAREAAGVDSICLAPYPKPDEFASDPEAEREMGWIVEAATFARNQRSASGLPPRAPASLALAGDGAAFDALVGAAPILKALAAIEAVGAGPAAPEAPRTGIGGVEVALVLAAKAAEPLGAEGRARAEADLAKVQKLLESTRARVEDPVFLSKAPAKIVEGARAQLADLAEQRDRLRALLEP
jgi:valyl-tRNA synthetase